jgi:hypothetical protein
MTKEEIIENLDLAKDWIVLVNNNPESEEVQNMTTAIAEAINLLNNK